MNFAFFFNEFLNEKKQTHKFSGRKLKSIYNALTRELKMFLDN